MKLPTAMMLLASLTIVSANEPYDLDKCLKAHGSGAWTCEDECNTCICGSEGLMETMMACTKVKSLHYDYSDCIREHGEGYWMCLDGCNGCICGWDKIISTNRTCNTKQRKK
ncbi:hypothetical protein E4U42_003059 [Claviceps africana]|uniref:Uncharacterized protein n=1 Tax=Claviceps africana TaxID=83212 RepID=A0A8K0J758_9HYPO|nr:hypothetical protein E4U42_003059 [Claviceps africana]